MTEQVPQPPAPETVPDSQMSQQSAAAQAGPDSGRQFPNPMQTAQGDSQSRDWEESFKGLSRKYNEDRREWDTEKQQFTATVDTLGQKFSELEQKLMGIAPQPEPAPQAPPAPTSDDGTQGHLEAMAERDAVLHRDKLLFEYVSKHPDVGLAQFRDNIPVVASTLNEDGTVNDQGQRDAIENLISGIQGVRQQGQQATQQAMVQGWTPGVSPGAPRDESWDSLVDRYYKVKERYSDPALDNSPGEQAKVQQEYYALHEKVGKHLPNQSAPWMSAGDLAESIRQIQGKIGHLEGFMMPNASPGS